MDKATYFLLIFSSFLNYALFAVNSEPKPQLVVISFDGFRWDYVQRFQTPNLGKIASIGTHAKRGYFASFTTKTFPTHWTIATGLYEESHGLMDNVFYDTRLKEEFTRASTDPKWFGGEPIWITAKKQGKRANVHFWPGSNVQIQGMRPDFYSQNYNQSIKLRTRSRMLLSWVTQGVDLSMMYYHEPDYSGHKHGAFSLAVKDQVEAIDREIGYLLKKLGKIEKSRNINLIILGDHGMINKTQQPLIMLDNYVDMNDVERIGQSGIICSILPKEGKVEKIYNDLKKAPKMSVYTKENLPKRFHYNHPHRTLPIIAIADPGHFIYKGNRTFNRIGYHGYDNENIEMKAIFYGKGPAFKINYEIDTLYSVDLYSLFCKILKLTPATNNGTLTNIEAMLHT